VRNDVGVETGSVVPIDYDPMLGKLIVHGDSRRQALARLARALSEYEIAGVETTLPLFRRLVTDPEFARADFDVHWLDRRLEPGFLEPAPVSREEILLAAAALAESATAPAPAVGPAALRSLWAETARHEVLRGSR
jgi:acetyl-CoA carboxylase biotin carboxylase subunit